MDMDTDIGSGLSELNDSHRFNIRWDIHNLQLGLAALPHFSSDFALCPINEELPRQMAGISPTYILVHLSH